MARNASIPVADPRRRLPPIARLLERPETAALIGAHGREAVLEALRAAVAEARAGANSQASADAQALVATAAARLERLSVQRMRPVVNATGIILHTGLGRAVLPARAARALASLGRCCNLQIDLETGQRGARNHECERLLARLTGAEAAMLVNNNAAATMLILAALCQGREVIVSRGQLIEIGGSYRLPDCIAQAGARLVEVGTTNKTHLRDYAGAIGEQTAALMHVNPSNYRIVGFSKSVPVAELAALKRDRPELLLIDDLGCGALIDLARFGLPHEPMVAESIAAGADIVCFSGDKLIGGPQAGIIAGRRDLISKIKKHPLTRMLRVDKMTDLALQETLRLFLEPVETLIAENPTLRMITLPAETIGERARVLAKRMEERSGGRLRARVFEGASEVGGGSLPATPIPTGLIGLRLEGISADQLNRALRANEPPIIARIENDEVVLDLRTVFVEEEEIIFNHAILENVPGF